MRIRHPVVAGSFYDGSESACRASLAKYIPESVACEELPERIVGGIVPHAGWVFSGAVVGQVFRAIAQQGQPEVFVLFGAMHRDVAQLGSIFADGAWRTPLGDVGIDDRTQRLSAGTALRYEQDALARQTTSARLQNALQEGVLPSRRCETTLHPFSEFAQDTLHVGTLS